MLRALIRFIFEMFIATLSGLTYILFDKEEIIGVSFKVIDQFNKTDAENKILIDYLNRCRKQVFKGK